MIPSTDETIVAPPTFWTIARRPRWIAALLGALAVAAIFAALGQWQVGRAVQTAVVTGPDTERSVPLERIERPQTAVNGNEAGRIVTVTGRLIPGDTTLLEGRFRVGSNGGLGGEQGWWVVGHLRTGDGVSLAVALGWAADRAEARAAETRIPTGERTMRGRYAVSESPAEDDPQKARRSALAVPALVNEWSDVGRAYGGYLVASAPTPGLDRIVAPPPAEQGQLSLLNLFYAVEWALFAGFAIYLWYRLVRDVLERELDPDAED